MKFRPFSELTKDFTPERWAEIDRIMAEQREEDHRASTATVPQEPHEGEAGRDGHHSIAGER